jgi:hypothetical protein
VTPQNAEYFLAHWRVAITFPLGLRLQSPRASELKILCIHQFQSGQIGAVEQFQSFRLVLVMPRGSETPSTGVPLLENRLLWD